MGKNSLLVLFSFWFAPRHRRDARLQAARKSVRAESVNPTSWDNRLLPVAGSGLGGGAAGANRDLAHAQDRGAERTRLRGRHAACADGVEPPLERHRDELGLRPLRPQEAV